MALYVSRFMEQKFRALPGQFDLIGLGQQFKIWRLENQAERRLNPYFGRDQPYEFVLPDGVDAIWHLHTAPDSADLDATNRWVAQFAAGDDDKTSDSALVYTPSVDGYDALMLFFFGDGAHDAVPRSARGDKFLRIVGRIAHEWRMQPLKVTEDWRLLLP